MKRMCCLCCKKSKDIDTDIDTNICKFTDITNTKHDNDNSSMENNDESREVNQSINGASSLFSLENSNSSLISREIEFLFELKKIQCILKGNDRLFNIDKLYHLFKQSIIKYNNSTKDFNEITFAILHEIIQLNSVQNNLLVAINQKIESHAKYLNMKQNEEEIIEKSNIYLQELKKIIDTVTNRDIYVYAKKKEKYAKLYMDKVSQITWKANLEYNFALTSYNTAFSIFTSKKDVIIGIIEQLLKKAGKHT